MRAVPTGDVPIEPGWAAEPKWDGMRIGAVIAGSDSASGPPTLTLWSGNGRDVTRSFPELQPLADALKVDAVLDGEIVVFDGERPSFARLQHRIHNEAPSPALQREHPAVYAVFDLLVLDGRSLTDLPYVTRRTLLGDLLAPGPRWRTTPHIDDDANTMLDLARARDLEGIVVKRLDSTYQPGARARSWQKIKLRRRQEFVVGAWLEGLGSLEGRVGSLLVGVWDDDELIVAGRVGSGLTDGERRRLETRLTPRADPPFVAVPPLDKKPVWVEPDTVVEVEFSEWPVGAMFRHPTYCGLRIDRDPVDVTREDDPRTGVDPQCDGSSISLSDDEVERRNLE